jgi:hypothetical protein
MEDEPLFKCPVWTITVRQGKHSGVHENIPGATAEDAAEGIASNLRPWLRPGEKAIVEGATITVIKE